MISTYQMATDLYGLAHARYLQTAEGLSLTRARVLESDFGGCLCCNQGLVPIGLSTELGHSKVKAYCYQCEDVYVPAGQREKNPKRQKAQLDGAYFGGPSFPQILLMNSPVGTFVGKRRSDTKLEPKLFGFKIHSKFS